MARRLALSARHVGKPYLPDASIWLSKSIVHLTVQHHAIYTTEKREQETQEGKSGLYATSDATHLRR